MKTIIFASFFFLSFLCRVQQKVFINSEFSLLDATNLWSVLDDFSAVHVHPSDPYSYTKSTWYKIGEDTTINDIDYKKLLLSSDPNSESWQPSGRLLRQVNDLIYSKDGTNQETLLYDFGMTIGDSIKTEIRPGATYVSILDSVKNMVLNNSTRKIYYLREFSETDPSWKAQEIWIEGIGSTTDGLLRQTMLGLTGGQWHEYQLLCFHQNENLIYQAKDFDNCFIDIADGISEIKDQSENVKVFPNPTTGQLTIEVNPAVSVPSTFEILSLSGKVIRTGNVSQTGLFTLSLSGMPIGIYFIWLTSSNYKTVQKFILK